MVFADIEAAFKNTKHVELSAIPEKELLISLAMKWSLIVDLEWLAVKLDQRCKQNRDPPPSAA